MNKLFSATTIKAGLLVGTLDILAASTKFYLEKNKGPAPLLKYIASGVFGKEAFEAGNSMAFYGLLFHYLIAFIFTLFFFWVCATFPSILRLKFLTGILYGGFIWSVMQFLVLPLSNTPKGPFNLTNAIIGVLILIACIGIPLWLIAANQMKRRK